VLIRLDYLPLRTCSIGGTTVFYAGPVRALLPDEKHGAVGNSLHLLRDTQRGSIRFINEGKL